MKGEEQDLDPPPKGSKKATTVSPSSATARKGHGKSTCGTCKGGAGNIEERGGNESEIGGGPVLTERSMVERET